MFNDVISISLFKKALRGLNENPSYDIFCTGSNANLLSGELSTLLAGKNIQIRVNPLSYKEFLQFHQLSSSIDSLNDVYIGKQKTDLYSF
ncbi:MAG: AAA family ATPase [Deltaproteobacteria bacterium]|nr:AAA family ATPase [Deltaproteobacteria bacterium]